MPPKYWMTFSSLLICRFIGWCSTINIWTMFLCHLVAACKSSNLLQISKPKQKKLKYYLCCSFRCLCSHCDWGSNDVCGISRLLWGYSRIPVSLRNGGYPTNNDAIYRINHLKFWFISTRHFLVIIWFKCILILSRTNS